MESDSTKAPSDLAELKKNAPENLPENLRLFVLCVLGETGRPLQIQGKIRNQIH